MRQREMTRYRAGGAGGTLRNGAARATADHTASYLVLTRDEATARSIVEEPTPLPVLNGSHHHRPHKVGLLERLHRFWLGEIDLAPLALFRIVYGILLVNWVWQLFPNLAPFFTDEGMLPRTSLLAFHPLRFSLLNLVGIWWQVCLFWLAGLAVALMLTVGYRTRLACAL